MQLVLLSLITQKNALQMENSVLIEEHAHRLKVKRDALQIHLLMLVNGLFLLIPLNQLIVLLKHAIQHLKISLLKVNVYNTSHQKQDPLAILNKVVVVFKEVVVQQLKFRLLVIQIQLDLSVLGMQTHPLVETKNVKIFLVQLMLLVRIQLIRTLKANVQLVKVVNVLLCKNVC